MAFAEILSPNIRYCAVISRLVAAYTLYMFPCMCNFGNKREHIFCRELTNRRPTKELEASFAFAKSQPTSATLVGEYIFYAESISRSLALFSVYVT